MTEALIDKVTKAQLAVLSPQPRELFLLLSRQRPSRTLARVGASLLAPLPEGRWREVEVPCDLSDALALLEHQRHRARLVFRATPEAFRTGWFIESLLTEVVVALVVRTQRPVLKSRPGKLLLWTSVGVAVGASVLGFVPVPVTMLLTLAVMTAAYVMTAEGLKRRLFPALMSGRRAAAPS